MPMTTKKNKVAIIMSTYNGERYIREQIDSILSQNDADITLFIRDDNSKDCTVSIINEYQQETNQVILYTGDNVGVGNSFMNLLYEIPLDFDYYAFADQDDIWLPDKIITAIQAIERNPEPALYCSNQLLVDKFGNSLGLRHTVPINTNYLQILCNNQVTGCTMVWNKSLHILLCTQSRRPSHSLLCNRIHDVWVAMVASVVGSIVYDEKAYILYRQHENNVVGVRKESILKLWINKLKNKQSRNGRSKIAKEVLEGFKDIIKDESILSTLSICADYNKSTKNKFELCKEKELSALSNENQASFIIKVLLNLF